LVVVSGFSNDIGAACADDTAAPTTLITIEAAQTPEIIFFITYSTGTH
jgi:hypothetical protein